MYFKNYTGVKMSDKVKFHRTARGKLFINTPEYREMKEKVESSAKDNDKYTNFYGNYETSDEFIKKLAIISAAAVMSDTVHRDEEMIVCEEICKELNLDWEEFSKLLDEETAKIKFGNISTIEKYLLKNIDKRNTTNAMVLFEAALHIILADGMMTDNECKLLADIGVLLQIPTSKIIARIGLFLKQEDDIIIDKPENFDWLYGGGSSDFY